MVFPASEAQMDELPQTLDRYEVASPVRFLPGFTKSLLGPGSPGSPELDNVSDAGRKGRQPGSVMTALGRKSST